MIPRTKITIENPDGTKTVVEGEAFVLMMAEDKGKTEKGRGIGLHTVTGGYFDANILTCFIKEFPNIPVNIIKDLPLKSQIEVAADMLKIAGMEKVSNEEDFNELFRPSH